MLIFQPDRFLLGAFIGTHAHMLTGDVLDVGGGPRRYAKHFAHCKSFRTLDIDKESHPDIVASAEAIPLPDASVDGVLCSQVLGDVWNVQVAIKEMARVLKPGGHILLTESLMNEEHDAPYDYWRFTQHTWQKLLGDDFKIITLKPRGGYYTQRAQQAIRYRINKFHAYQRPILGRVLHLWALIVGHIAIARDQNACEANKAFTIGHCILAQRL